MITVAIEIVGSTDACEFDCPAFLERWGAWWRKQIDHPVALLAGGPGYMERLDAKSRNMVRKADSLYEYRRFDYNTQLDAIYAINTSKPIRSGGEMSDKYLLPPEPIKKDWNVCADHRSVWYGGYDAAGVLVAYCNLIELHDLGVVNTVLGHAEAPAAMNGLFAHMVAAAPVRWIHYLSLASSPDGLRAFKESLGFAEYTVLRRKTPAADGVELSPGVTLASGRLYPHSFGPLDFDRLDKFIGEHVDVQPLAEFARGRRDIGVLSMRHDVDHSARYALRFAEWEESRGIRSTYFLLPTADYYPTEARDVAVELERMGHEVGVHNDAMNAARGTPERAAEILAGWVAEMRDWGITVIGCADHGGHPFSNTDMWRKHGLVPADVGLEYEAYGLHQLQTHYVSDNGGRFTVPLERRDDRPTHMLVHPCHWQLPVGDRREVAA